MAAGLGDLVISLSADIARFESDMGRAARIAEKQAAAIQSSFTLIKGAVGVIAGSAVLGYVEGLVASAEATGRLAERTGYAVGFLSELGFAMSRGNVPTESWSKALEKFNVSLVDGTNSSTKASQVFKLLGVDIAKGPTEALKQFADRASAIDDAATKTAVFRLIMGKTGDELIPVMKNLDDATAAARRLGVTMSEETAENAKKLDDALVSLSAQSKALTLEALTPMITAFATMATNIEQAAEKGEKWTQVMREAFKLGASVLGGFGIQDQRMESAFNAFSPKPSLFSATIANFSGAQGPHTEGPIGAPNTNALNRVLSGDAAKGAAELKQYQSALQALEEKLGKFNDQTEVEATRIKITDGSLKDLTASHKAHLLVVAADVDKRKQLVDRIDEHTAAFGALYAAMERADGIQRDFALAGQQDIAQRQFALTLIGKTAVQVERLNALHEIDLRLQSALRAAADNAGEDLEALALTQAQLRTKAQQDKNAVDQLITDRLKAERSWVVGADQAFDDYLSRATNAAEQTSGLFKTAFSTLEDIELDFVMKSGANWRNYANTFINELMRMELRAQNAKVFGAIQGVGGISGLLGQATLLASGKSDAAMEAILNMGFPEYEVGTDYVPRTGLALVHQGEKITPAGASNRDMAPTVIQHINVGGNVTHADIPMILTAAKQVALAAVDDRNKRGR